MTENRDGNRRAGQIEYQHIEGQPLFTQSLVQAMQEILGGNLEHIFGPGYSDYRLNEPGKFHLALVNNLDKAKERKNTSDLYYLSTNGQMDIYGITSLVITPGESVAFIWEDPQRVSKLILARNATPVLTSEQKQPPQGDAS